MKHMTKEKYIENKIKIFLKANNHYFIKIHGSGVQKSGVPDILACINGKFVGIEVKQEKGKPSRLQIEHQRLIEESGGKSIIVYSYSDFLTFYYLKFSK